MRSHLVAAAIIASLGLVAQSSTAHARPHPKRNSKSFEANKGFGLGLMLGVPSGLSGKYYLGDDTALDFGVGAYYRSRYNDAFHAHMDFLWHPVVLASPDAFWLPLYFGVGARVLQHGNSRDYNEHTHIGVRVPVGIDFDFNNVPLDIFIELAFVFDVIVDHADHGYADLNSAVGIRYYFD